MQVVGDINKRFFFFYEEWNEFLIERNTNEDNENKHLLRGGLLQRGAEKYGSSREEIWHLGKEF
jgi:hypothetical protein